MTATIDARTRSGTGINRGTNAKPMPIGLAPLEEASSRRMNTTIKYATVNRASFVGSPMLPPTPSVVFSDPSHFVRKRFNFFSTQLNRRTAQMTRVFCGNVRGLAYKAPPVIGGHVVASTSKLPGTQHAPRSGILLLRVRAERNVSWHPVAREWLDKAEADPMDLIPVHCPCRCAPSSSKCRSQSKHSSVYR
jgi:hypothetical protein